MWGDRSPLGALAGMLGERVAHSPVGRVPDTRGLQPRMRAQLDGFSCLDPSGEEPPRGAEIGKETGSCCWTRD